MTERRFAKLIGGPEDGAVKEIGAITDSAPHVPEIFRLSDGTAYELMEFLPWWMEKAPALLSGQFPYVHHRHYRGGLIGSE